MDKIYNHKSAEEKIYKMWEDEGFFTPKINKDKKPFSIILPPPNANAPLHFGHAMYVVEDILIRYHRMKGDPTLWLPGADHAGFETQFVFEKKLEKEGKSRFDFDRETLYEMILNYVLENKKGMQNQLRRLGFSLDWSRNKFTLDEDIISIVYKTFKKMYDDKLIYRGERLVNYCTKCGTSFSDLEVNHKEQKDPLYYLRYGPFILATVRPETKFGDTAVAVNPKDKRYKDWVGKEIEVNGVIGKFKVIVIADEVIDPDFGTGVAKVTPAHDVKDFEIGLRHNLKRVQVIDFNGRLNKHAGKYQGLRVKEARKRVAEDMEEMGLIEKIDHEYTHVIEVCYKCGTTIEPMLMPQWFIKMEQLAKPAIEAILKKKIKFYPKRHEKAILFFLKNIKDWNISRQIVWGIRIPAWQCEDCSEWTITSGNAPDKCSKCNSRKVKQDSDTFDTWFSSSQWPFATLKARKGDFEYFYPTSVMETMYDILLFWVARMIMVGIYITNDVPFREVVLHGMVKDPLGKKMSKSKGNVVDPLETVDLYGADAVRFALVYGTAFGNDQALSYPKLDAARKFTNKLWNMARFIEFSRQNLKLGEKPTITNKVDEWNEYWRNEIKKLVTEVSRDIDKYNFNFAAEKLYEFIWHRFADKYIEDLKPRMTYRTLKVLEENFNVVLKLLHPFMPFVTEEIYQRFNPATGGGRSIMIDSWPKM
ncbi:valine--tRNA ligase [Patescibacteria group bacterium]|nr:valine--tRNA ligase [Patescibacteria group bacterium]